MKIIQTDTVLTIKLSGIMNVIIGGALMVGGIVVAIVFLYISSGPWLWLIGVAVAILGGLLLLTAKNTIITLDKNGQSIVKASRVIGGKTNQDSFATELATSVELETHTEYDRSTTTNGNNSTNRRQVSSLYVHFSDNSQLVVAEN